MTPGRIIGNAVLPDGVRPVAVAYDSGSGSVTSIEDTREVTEDSVLLFPGFIDIHVHAREYARPGDGDPIALKNWEKACRKETFATAGEAAVNGGVTLFGAMPNDPNPPADEKSYSRKKALVETSPCPAILFAAVTAVSEPWADVPYKVYLDATPSSVSFSSWSDLEGALSRYKRCKVFFHAEDPEMLKQLPKAGPRWLTRPPKAEIRAVEKILEFTAKLGLRTHICHVSTEHAVDLITEYNAGSSEPVTCEATPHHLFFNVEGGEVSAATGNHVEERELLGCNPPLRSEKDRLFLLEALRDGRIDVLASDHAPHTREDKAKSAPGMPHLDTLGAFAGWLFNGCGFSAERIARILSTIPGRIFASELELPHGIIEPGAAASFTVLDLSRQTIVSGSKIAERGPLKTRCAWSPFSGIPLPARVEKTVIRGREFGFAR